MGKIAAIVLRFLRLDVKFLISSTYFKFPLVLAFIDYKLKKGGIGPLFYPTGDYEKDLPEIEKFYVSISAKHPESFNLSEQNRPTIQTKG